MKKTPTKASSRSAHTAKVTDSSKKDWSPRRHHNPDFTPVSAPVAKRVADDIHRHYSETDHPQADRTVIPHNMIFQLPQDEVEQGRTHQALVITEVKIGRGVKRNATNLRFAFSPSTGVRRETLAIQP